MPRDEQRREAAADRDGQAPRLITTVEAAKHLGVSPRTVQRWAQEGLVRPALRLPKGQLRWNMNDLMRQLQEMGEAQQDQ